MTKQKVLPIVAVVAIILGAYAALKGNEATHADSSQYKPLTYMLYGSGQMWAGMVSVLAGAGWLGYKSLASDGTKPVVIPSGLVGDDPSFVSINKAVDETTKFTQEQIDALKKEFDARVAMLTKARDDRVATLKGIKPGGAA